MHGVTGGNESGWIAYALSVAALAATLVNVVIGLRVQNAVLRMKGEVLDKIETEFVRKEVYQADLKRIEAGMARTR